MIALKILFLKKLLWSTETFLHFHTFPNFFFPGGILPPFCSSKLKKWGLLITHRFIKPDIFKCNFVTCTHKLKPVNDEMFLKLSLSSKIYCSDENLDIYSKVQIELQRNTVA